MLITAIGVHHPQFPFAIAIAEGQDLLAIRRPGRGDAVNAIVVLIETYKTGAIPVDANHFPVVVKLHHGDDCLAVRRPGRITHAVGSFEDLGRGCHRGWCRDAVLLPHTDAVFTPIRVPAMGVVGDAFQILTGDVDDLQAPEIVGRNGEFTEAWMRDGLAFSPPSWTL